jgi:hypothetical protein
MLPMRRVSQPGAWFNRGPSSERTDLPGCRGRQISNPQPNPQFVVSCTSYGYFGSPRVLGVLVSGCKLSRQRSRVRVSSSPPYFQALTAGPEKNLGPFGSNKLAKSSARRAFPRTNPRKHAPTPTTESELICSPTAHHPAR